MPMFDYLCRAGHGFERLVKLAERDHQTCLCGQQAERMWLSHAPAMRPDSIPGGIVLENLTSKPKRYYSRTEIKDEMRARGVMEKVRHIGVPGSDRNPNTTRWV